MLSVLGRINLTTAGFHEFTVCQHVNACGSILPSETLQEELILCCVLNLEAYLSMQTRPGRNVLANKQMS